MNKCDLERYMREAVKVSRTIHQFYSISFLNDAIEVDVDCLSDCPVLLLGGVMEHIEQAGKNLVTCLFFCHHIQAETSHD